MARSSSWGPIVILAAAALLARTGALAAADGTVTEPHNTSYWGTGTKTTTTTTTPTSGGGTTVVVKETITSTEKNGTTHAQIVTTKTVSDSAGNPLTQTWHMDYTEKRDGKTTKWERGDSTRTYNPLGGYHVTYTNHFVIPQESGTDYVVEHHNESDFDAADHLVAADHHEVSDIGTARERDLHTRFDAENNQFREVDANGNYVKPPYPKANAPTQPAGVDNPLPEPVTESAPYKDDFGTGTRTTKTSTIKSGSNTIERSESHVTVKNAKGETHDVTWSNDTVKDRSGNVISEKSAQHEVDKDAAGNPLKTNDWTLEKKYNEAGGYTQTATDTTTTVTKDGNHVDKETTTENHDAAGNTTSGEKTKTTNAGESSEKTVKERWNGTSYQQVDANGYFMTASAARTPVNPWVAGAAVLAGGILASNTPSTTEVNGSNGISNCAIGRMCFTPSSLQFSAPNQTLPFSVSVPGNTGSFSLTLSCPSGGSGTPSSWSGSGSSGNFTLQSLTTSSGRPCFIQGSASNGATAQMQVVF